MRGSSKPQPKATAMLVRRLEPEVMDTPEEARDYNAMDHSTVNRVFVSDLIETSQLVAGHRVLDVGTGTALIPIELCRVVTGLHVTAIDLASEMLKLAHENVRHARLTDCISLELLDAKRLPFVDHHFDAVISNSIVHHIPEPAAVFAEMVRVLKPRGWLFVRDLLRPESEADVERLVALYAGNENNHSQQMFRQSLQAALSLDEVRDFVRPLGLSDSQVRQTTDRHWTLAWQSGQ